MAKQLWSGLKRKHSDANSLTVTVSVGKNNFGKTYVYCVDSMGNTGTQSTRKNSVDDAETSRRGTHQHRWILAAVVVLAFTLICVIGLRSTNLTLDQVKMIFSIWEKIIKLTF